jgi:SOS-response transcriptional repressor LexA
LIPRTRRQNQALEAIRKLTIEGVPPSIAELAGELGYAHRAAVHGLLCELRDRGLITWVPKAARSIRIVEPALRREDLERYDDEALRRIASWAHAILAQRGAA